MLGCTPSVAHALGPAWRQIVDDLSPTSRNRIQRFPKDDEPLIQGSADSRASVGRPSTRVTTTGRQCAGAPLEPIVTEPELLSMAGDKLEVGLVDVGKLREVWTSAHTHARKNASLWAPPAGGEGLFGSFTKLRLCVGHYGEALPPMFLQKKCPRMAHGCLTSDPNSAGNGEYERPRGDTLMPHLEDTSVWQPFKRSRWLTAALEHYAPHPAAFRRVWSNVAEEKSKSKQEDRSKPLYAWEPLPPTDDFLALGMLFTTT